MTRDASLVDLTDWAPVPRDEPTGSPDIRTHNGPARAAKTRRPLHEVSESVLSPLWAPLFGV